MNTPTQEISASSDLLDRNWQQFARTRDKGARDFLVEHYLPRVRAAAKHLHAKLPSHVDVEDLVSAGMLGLMAAVESFDPRRGVKFETFCAIRIRGAILDWLRTTDWAPRQVRSRSRRLAKATEVLEAELGRPPTDPELAQHVQWSLRKVQDLKWDTHTAMMTSLDQGLPETDFGEKQTLEGVLADKAAEDPSRKAMRADVREILVRGLGKTERLVVLLYYYEQMTLKEIGLVLNLSESRVSQIHSGVLAQLREQLSERGSELMEDLVHTTVPRDHVA
jgi:RNA polymerase sigma factor FliA